MGKLPVSISRWLLPVAFAAVSSSAGLQWFGLKANREVARQRASREALVEFSALLARYESAPPKQRPVAARELTSFAERMPAVLRDDYLASAYRRVLALTSFEANSSQADQAIQERLRDEIRGLIARTETAESIALRRATQAGTANQMLAFLAMGTLGFGLLRVRIPAST